MLYIVISFDYELFMGKNRLPEYQVLIEPAEKVSTMLLKNGIHATFFADVCSAIKYRKEGMESFPIAFDRQLQEFKKRGHDIQLHIHPHWEKSTHIGGDVAFPPESYRLYNWIQYYGADETEKIVHECAEYLRSIMYSVDSEYRCIAFRAGGYCLQPERDLANMLYKEGIRIDSSVTPGGCKLENGCYFDYRDYSDNKNVFFSNEYGFDSNLTERIENGIFEVPIGTFSKKPYNIVARLLKKTKHFSAPNAGSFMQLGSNDNSITRSSVLTKIKNTINARTSLSFDYNNSRTMIYVLKHIAKECDGKKDIYISCVSHPKCLSDEHIVEFEKVIRCLKMEKRISFVTMSDVADRLQLL